MQTGASKLLLFCPEGHLSYNSTVREPDTLRNVFRVMLHSAKSRSFSFIHYFFIIDKMSLRARWNGFAGRIRPTGRRLETPDVDKNSPTPLKLYGSIELAQDELFSTWPTLEEGMLAYDGGGCGACLLRLAPKIIWPKPQLAAAHW